ncbi:hypothetical protein C2W62_54095, partial [Candidatus Entotheonella serta]
DIPIVSLKLRPNSLLIIVFCEAISPRVLPLAKHLYHFATRRALLMTCQYMPFNKAAITP